MKENEVVVLTTAQSGNFESGWAVLYCRFKNLYDTYRHEHKHHALYKGTKHNQGRKPRYKDHRRS